MTDHFIPIAEPDLRGNERKYLNDCIDSNFVSSVGPFVSRFEEMIATISGAPVAVATSSGTAGLHLALVALGVARDDLVILPSFSFIATANAVSYCAADPWFLDIDEESWTLDVKGLRTALETQTVLDDQGRRIHIPTSRRVSAIMPVCALGEAADMDAICAVATEFSLPVVVDAAPALGATYKSMPLGSLDAALTVFSFNGNKTVTAGGGGAVVGKDKTLLARVRHLSTTARVGPDYDHDEVGYNYRMTNIQAAVGCAQLERLEAFLEAKMHIRAKYAEAISGLNGVVPLPAAPWGKGSAWLSGVRLDPPNPETALSLCQAFRENGIDARPIWKPIHLQKPYLAAPKMPLPRTEAMWQNIVTLPSSANLSTEDLAHILSVLRTAVLAAI